MKEVIVLGELRRGQLRPVGLELVGAALALCEQGAGPVALATIDAEAEPNSAQAALRALIAERRPVLVLAEHRSGALAFLPALAAQGGYGFARDVTSVGWGEHGPHARRGVYGEPTAELEFPGKETVVLLLRPGAFAPADPGDGLERVECRPHADLRVEHVEYRERAPGVGGAELGEADFLLAVGRGLGGDGVRGLARMQRLADRLGATLAVSGALVEAGFAPGTRKVGVSGRRVAPIVYLALGVSGAPQHLGGIARSHTILAVNSDPDARIFELAHYGAVADAYEVVNELERRLS